MSKLHNPLTRQLVSNLWMERNRGKASTMAAYGLNNPSYLCGLTWLLARSIGWCRLLALAATVVACHVEGRGTESEWMGPAAAAVSSDGGQVALPLASRAHEQAVLKAKSAEPSVLVSCEQNKKEFGLA
jgi:hypothetical protein